MRWWWSWQCPFVPAKINRSEQLLKHIYLKGLFKSLQNIKFFNLALQLISLQYPLCCLKLIRLKYAICDINRFPLCNLYSRQKINQTSILIHRSIDNYELYTLWACIHIKCVKMVWNTETLSTNFFFHHFVQQGILWDTRLIMLTVLWAKKKCYVTDALNIWYTYAVHLDVIKYM